MLRRSGSAADGDQRGRSPNCCCDFFQPLGWQSVDRLGRHSLDEFIIKSDRTGDDTDMVAVGLEACFTIRIQDRTQLCEAPAQRRAWIIRNVPEELAEPFATLRLFLQRKVGEKCTRLTRLRQRHHRAVAPNREVTEHFEFKCQSGRPSRSVPIATVAALRPAANAKHSALRVSNSGVRVLLPRNNILYPGFLSSLYVTSATLFGIKLSELQHLLHDLQHSETAIRFPSLEVRHVRKAS